MWFHIWSGEGCNNFNILNMNLTFEFKHMVCEHTFKRLNFLVQVQVCLPPTIAKNFRGFEVVFCAIFFSFLFLEGYLHNEKSEGGRESQTIFVADNFRSTFNALTEHNMCFSAE